MMAMVSIFEHVISIVRMVTASNTTAVVLEPGIQTSWLNTKERRENCGTAALLRMQF